MDAPFFLVLCENGAKRDEELLRRLLRASGVRDMKIIPRERGVLEDQSARLITRHQEQNPGQDLVVVLHVDGDEQGLSNRRAEIDAWVEAHQLRSIRIVRCVPVPCTERWLCFGTNVRVKAKRTKKPCEPWKKAWEARKDPEWKRLEEASAELLRRSEGLLDLAAFLSDLTSALGTKS